MNLKVSSNEIFIFCIRTEVFFSQQLDTNMPSVGILYLSKRGKTNMWSTCFRESLKISWTPQEQRPLLYRFPLRPYNQPLVSLRVRSWGIVDAPSVRHFSLPCRLKPNQNDVPRPKRVQVRLWRVEISTKQKKQSTGQCWWFLSLQGWHQMMKFEHLIGLLVIWVVATQTIFSFHPYLGKNDPILT